ncbi:MAG TPA: hypothetical protein VE843_03125 [Ktedonobacteraceae bacterium]|nr:hypothetical protein [Ktedonobacteraceae bacterium]
MTLLIIGGLLIIAILAILGAVFLSVSDQRTAKAQTNSSVTMNSQSTTPVVQQSLAASRTTERSTPLRQNLPSAAERPLSTTGGDQQHFALNGQFHELAVELQTLYQHAWELERRLRTLAEVAERIEETHNNQIATEEEFQAQPSADGTV